MNVCRHQQSGLTYIEVMVAAALLTIALLPAMNALYTGMRGQEVFASVSAEHYAVVARLEEMLAEPRSALLSSAAAAGDYKTESSYSDAPGTANRRLVFIGLYNPDDSDGDGDPFTVPDPDQDGDGNPFTGYDGLLWVEVEIDESETSLESLSAP